MTRKHSTLPILLLLVALASACSYLPGPKIKETEESKAKPAPTPALAKVKTRNVGEEKIGASSSSPGEATSPEKSASVEPVAVQPPDPETMVASIGPSTSPQRAASLRLTDEGRRLLGKGDSTAAVDRLEKAVKIDPSNAHGYYWLAQVYDRNGKPDQALAFVDKSVVLFAQDDHVWLAQAYTFRGSILERTGRFKDARTSYQRALQAEPGSVAARAAVARLGEAPSF